MAVFVLGKKKQPLMPCSEKRARLLLERGRAVVAPVHPLTIRLKDRVSGDTKPVAVKIDPGSRTTGITVVRENESTDTDTGELRREATALALMELEHRGALISKKLTARAAFRRRRRSANLRHRAPRFDNRSRPEGSPGPEPAAPGRYDDVLGGGDSLALAPVTRVAMELAPFDPQKMENPEISGVEYQQGNLLGYEAREYVFEKWGRQCAYCDRADCPPNLDHVRSRACGGSDRVMTDFLPACIPCNEDKAARPVEEFLAKDPERLARILENLKTPLKDAAAVNSTRWALFQAIKATGLPVECGSGGRTKFNRRQMGVLKPHALDAACVGRLDVVERWQAPTLGIKATPARRLLPDASDGVGFTRGRLMRKKGVKGFQTGDMAPATVMAGKKTGIYVGRVAVRANGSFNIQTVTGVVQGINAKHCKLIQRGDGYGYRSGASSPALNAGVSAPKER